MNIVFIVPGVGDTFYCQNCVRNLNLVRELRRCGHQPLIVPMYLPLNFETSDTQDVPIFFGAVNVYLKEKLPFYDRVPRWIKRRLEARALLGWVARKAGSTDPDGLEEMTLSIMRPDAGKHARELERMIDWLRDEVRPDVVHLSNGLLIGIGVRIRRELGVPVFVTLQDEDQWIDRMAPRFARQAWELLGSGARAIDLFTPVSAYYCDFVRERSGVAADKMAVVPIGVEIGDYRKRSPEKNPRTIGYLSRMTGALGLDILVDAYLLLKADSRFSDLRLKVSGGLTPADKGFVRKIIKKIRRAGWTADVDICDDFSNSRVGEFFDALTLVCVPAPKGEAFGLFIVESLASGIPVVEPDAGGYPEIIKRTGGGLVYEPNNPQTLARALDQLLSDPERLDSMSRQGRSQVEEHYSVARMARTLLDIYSDRLGK